MTIEGLPNGRRRDDRQDVVQPTDVTSLPSWEGVLQRLAHLERAHEDLTRIVVGIQQALPPAVAAAAGRGLALGSPIDAVPLPTTPPPPILGTPPPLAHPAEGPGPEGSASAVSYEAPDPWAAPIGPEGGFFASQPDLGLQEPPESAPRRRRLFGGRRAAKAAAARIAAEFGAQPLGATSDTSPPAPPPGFAGLDAVPPAPPGFAAAPPPPPPPSGFAEAAVPTPPGYGQAPPPPPAGYGAEAAVAPPPAGFAAPLPQPAPPAGYGQTPLPPPPAGFAANAAVAPPPAGFAAPPPPPAGFAADAAVPPAPPGFATSPPSAGVIDFSSASVARGGFDADIAEPQQPGPAFAGSWDSVGMGPDELVFDAPETAQPPAVLAAVPPPGFATSPNEPTAPPPPAGYGQTPPPPPGYEQAPPPPPGYGEADLGHSTGRAATVPLPPQASHSAGADQETLTPPAGYGMPLAGSVPPPPTGFASTAFQPGQGATEFFGEFQGQPSTEPPTAETAPVGPNGDESPSYGEAPPITPDFFARSPRGRRH
jgi:hypothetical protein